MLNIRNIFPLSDFQRNAKEFILQMQESHKPIVLTVNGKASVVMQDAESYQDLLNELELARSVSAIRQSMQETAEGKDVSAVEGLQMLREKHEIPN
jgi:prevent-host-death family protein